MSDRIQEARRRVVECEIRLEGARSRVKECREGLKDAVISLYGAIDDEANGVQDLPFGEPDGEPAADHEEDDGEPVDKPKSRKSRAG